MKRFLLLLLSAALLVTPANAQAIIGLRSLGYAQMTSLAAATPLPSVPSGTEEAFIVCTGQTVYWRDDGTDPTATVGMPLVANQPFPYTGPIPRIKLIQSTATAVCNITYYGQ